MKINKLGTENRSERDPQKCTFEPKSPHLMVSEDWEISIKKSSAAIGESEWQKVSLAKYYLPPNKLFQKPIKLTFNEDFCLSICMAIDNYLIKNRLSKSTHLIILRHLDIYAKFFEYCWLNSIYHLNDFPKACWTDFLTKFSRGNWFCALDILERTRNFASTLTREEAQSYISSQRKQLGYSLNISNQLQLDLGTNAFIANSRQNRKVLFDILQKTDQSSNNISPDYRHDAARNIDSLLSKLTALTKLPSNLRLNSLPLGNKFVDITKELVQSGRTRSLSPDQLAQLLLEAHQWVSNFSGPIISLYEAFDKACPVSDVSLPNHIRRSRLKKLPETRLVESVVGVKVVRLGGMSFGENISLSSLGFSLAMACFLVIGTMNARRKDEVVGKTIGMFHDCLTIENESLGLYKCLFYIEKTSMKYEQFYVNEMTHDAFQVMKKLSSITWRRCEEMGETIEREKRKIFALPIFSQRESQFQWFSNVPRRRYEAFYHRCFRNSGSYTRIHGHMFRRAYALVFHYRYENATLLALSRQLRHRDLGLTCIYVLEPGTRDISERGETLWAIPKNRTNTGKDIWSGELFEELEEVSKEKLFNSVVSIIEGSESFSGGFVKLINRLHGKLGNRIDYVKLSKKDQGKLVADMLIDRGHRSEPFGHGDCNAAGPSALARCYDEGDNRLKKRRRRLPCVDHAHIIESLEVI